MNLGCHGGFSLDEATRRSWYNPDAILKDLRFGMVFVDVGCGDGFFSILAAKKVGDKGRVYAVDIDSNAIAKLKNKAEAEGLPNIVTVVGRAEDTVFCDQCADFVLYSMNLHDFADPEKVLRNAKQMIKPDGQIVDLDWKKEEMPFGPPDAIRFSEERACGLMRSAGFSAINSYDAGPHHYIVKAKI
jgi:ubiquinone/menaquinone biosynthesis C-methylase UbiE